MSSILVSAFNLALIILVAIPSSWLVSQCFNGVESYEQFSGFDDFSHSVKTVPIESLYRACYHHPLLFVNVAFFFNVCVLFWVLSRIQRSTWLIDPYWTIIPPLIALYYHFHPLSIGEVNRKDLVLFLTMIWALRLTHSYFRREHWEIGCREDWRFTDMQKQNPDSWWIVSFFAAFVSQQPMLVGITLPLWAVNFSSKAAASAPLGNFDIAAAMLCLCGITIAYFADTQLYTYCEWVSQFRAQQDLTHRRNKAKPIDAPPLVLCTGLWKYSRHPNYFGEMMWWWSLGLFGVIVGEPWTLVGTAFNSLVMYQVTQLTEGKMRKNQDRLHEFLAYVKGTSMWVPWFSTFQPNLCATTNKKKQFLN